ncbi:hypothetical protein PAAG_04462 [Paracoccidioides lutzii Pb01]|uniref:Uncharacterized protein n=1 Tax=Paracoccidioides lutzii (strain ATCC MYA-826 / Pb01) TaxID=502779 RepID=C1H118_PARBA|nr:hypothetical protein PAAG_04462 [Paracoccidioides lutzii Pb01]EEH33412.2 hypothetical protein PAAG_04462 [Paracoccidioides lutzii Pb01]
MTGSSRNSNWEEAKRGREIGITSVARGAAKTYEAVRIASQGGTWRSKPRRDGVSRYAVEQQRPLGPSVGTLVAAITVDTLPEGRVPAKWTPFQMSLQLKRDSGEYVAKRCKTATIRAKERSPKELIRGVYGYGHTFPEIYTDWDKSVKGSATNQRVIRNEFGGLNFLREEKTPTSKKDLVDLGESRKQIDMDEVSHTIMGSSDPKYLSLLIIMTGYSTKTASKLKK